jgi:hypothetical protein
VAPSKPASDALEHIDAALSQRPDHGFGDMFICVELNRLAHRRSAPATLAHFRRRLLAQALRKPICLGNRSIDLGLVVEIIRQGRVDIGQRQIILRRDFVHAFSHAFVPDHDILDCDAMSTNARFSARDAWRHLDVVIFRVHWKFSSAKRVPHDSTLLFAAIPRPITQSSLTGAGNRHPKNASKTILNVPFSPR